MRRIVFLLVLLLAAGLSKAQLLSGKQVFTRSDTLRGMLSPLRSCYDVNYYHLDIRVNIAEKKISGSNLFKFTAKQDFRKLQFDLFENLQIEKIIYKGQTLNYSREFNAVFIEFPELIKAGSQDAFTVYYSGNPVTAKNAPWDGGFVYSKDALGKPWVAVACQGLGASSWWPCKDHQSDEADSVLISVAVPDGLTEVSNGRLRSSVNLKDGYTQFSWFVSYPINNYCVTLNIGDYAHFTNSYNGLRGKLDIDYYVLKENLEKAKQHFPSNVSNMFRSFEHWFGPYPFYRDGYKLIETPYLGMEHQSAIAYGNDYKKGYRGTDLSGTGLGLKWDYLIIHESGHEWFGNNITSQDLADMWIHESFTCYSEGLFVESTEGKAAGAKYIKGLRKRISNTEPIIAAYNVNQEGSGDMYYKGANLLHTIRFLINDDVKWQEILEGLNKTFGLKTITTEEVVGYINKQSGRDFTKIFDQYLRYADIPLLEVQYQDNNQFRYRWNTDVKHFDMPIRMKTGPNDAWITLQPSSEWQSHILHKSSSGFIIDDDNFYIKTKKN